MTVELATLFPEGVFASRPAAAAAVEYFATDTGKRYYSNGSTWSEQPPKTTAIAFAATDKLLGRSTAGAGAGEEIALTAAGRAIIDDADASAQRTTLGLGTLATQSGTFSGTSSGTNTGDQTVPAFATPALTLGTANAAGAASTVIRSDATILAFDATVPEPLGTAAAGASTTAARRSHVHALPAIDATAAATDITTRNVSTTAHGLAPKLPNDATKYLDGTGAYTVPPAASGMTDPMTTRGDIIIRNAANATARLGRGAAGTVLTSDGTDVAYAAPVSQVNADSSADVTLTADTIADATGVSVSLVAGTWIIWAEMTFSATTSTFDYCLVDITDSSNVVVGEARGNVNSNSPVAYSPFVVVSPGSTTTYKLRGQSGRTGNKILRYGQGTNIGTRMVALKVA